MKDQRCSALFGIFAYTELIFGLHQAAILATGSTKSTSRHLRFSDDVAFLPMMVNESLMHALHGVDCNPTDNSCGLFTKESKNFSISDNTLNCDNNGFMKYCNKEA
jgi:hypothetical protein